MYLPNLPTSITAGTLTLTYLNDAGEELALALESALIANPTGLAERFASADIKPGESIVAAIMADEEPDLYAITDANGQPVAFAYANAVDFVEVDETDGGETDGDETDGDETDGDETDGDETDGDETDGDEIEIAIHSLTDEKVVIPAALAFVNVVAAKYPKATLTAWIRADVDPEEDTEARIFQALGFTPARQEDWDGITYNILSR